MNKAVALLKIIRPVNFLITFFSVIVAGIICSPESSINYLPILFAGFSAALVGSAGNVINDILDIEIDRINRPERMLPSGLLNPRGTFYYYLVLNSAALLLSAFINITSLLIVIVSILIVFFYSYTLKKIPLIGNITVAFMTGLAFIFGGTAAGNIKGGIIPALFAFLINFIRELIKDIEDLEGDMKNQVFSFPAKYGTKAAVQIIYSLTGSLIVFTLIPFFFNLYRIEYFIIVMLSVNIGLVLFIKNISSNSGKAVISRESFLLKIYMIFGLIAIYFGNY